jgi:hypothetical protein
MAAFGHNQKGANIGTLNFLQKNNEVTQKAPILAYYIPCRRQSMANSVSDVNASSAQA